ncbi:MAG: hypothetical protein HOO88_03315 [Kiritimatiellaceae bacterium]|nr:hypothetical protein [Kiritimatiellaceae bacterium]
MLKRNLAVAATLLQSNPLPAALPELNTSFGHAKVQTQDNGLIVSTGKVERRWMWTGGGFTTVSLKDLKSGKEWISAKTGAASDWQIPGINETVGQLVSLTAEESTDEGFTSPHLNVQAEIAYPVSGKTVRYRIWAYPDAPGLRTQVGVKGGTLSAAASAKEAVEIVPQTGRDIDKDNIAVRAGTNGVCSFAVKGLDPAKSYQLGLSWIDLWGQNRTQTVTVFSGDKESSQIIIEANKLPQPDALPEALSVGITRALYHSGTCTIQITNQGNYDPVISELWINESEPGDKKSAVAYLNCGAAKAQDAMTNMEDQEGVADTLPVNLCGLRLIAWGYADDTQSINSPTMPILREQNTDSLGPVGEIIWASGMDLSDQSGHLIVVKESNKCFNTDFAANNGRFAWSAAGLRNTGLGWLPEELSGDNYKDGWATWIMLGNGSDDEAQLVLKQFDRFRYPVHPGKDIYILANTWGSAAAKIDSQLAARESNLLREIDSAADLGIDIQQVDDGWQGYETGGKNWRPIASLQAPDGACVIEEYGSETIPVYPDGWVNIRKHAQQKNIKLGLWVHGSAVPIEDLIWNQRQGGFSVVKYDFFNMRTMAEAQMHLNKMRTFIKAADHQVRVNWDVTDKPRIGYYLGRDQGAIYLENRKPKSPASVIYKPYLVLRDAWEISKYVNLNKFELTVQNADRVSRNPDSYGETSDAWKHPHDYCFAQTMMGTPIFFQETQLYTPEARAQLKPLIALYRKHRAALYAGYAFALGAQPDNRNWSGFQNYNPETGVSYLTVFRQIENSLTENEIDIKFYPPESRLRVTNLVNNESTDRIVGNNGAVKLTIPQAPGFLFLRVEKM